MAAFSSKFNHACKFEGWRHQSIKPSPLRHCTVRAVTDVGSGLRLKHLGGQEELQLLFSECYSESCCYLGGDFISLRPGNTVVDVGANIGLFSLFASKKVESTGCVIGVEPFPEAAQAARENVESHLMWCSENEQNFKACKPLIINAAAGDSSLPSVELTAYSRAVGWSTLVPDDEEVLQNMRSYLEGLLSQPQDSGNSSSSTGTQGPASSSLQSMPDSVMIKLGRTLRGTALLRPISRLLEEVVVRTMLASKRLVNVPQVTLSGVIQEHGLERIDLLKVDVERAELQVLGGIMDQDWPRIRQVSLEVHNVDKRVEHLCKVLRSRGFSSTMAQQDARMAGTNLWMVYAKR
ncbi:S-adenosyl-L-methionine-dependent methyltransferase [Dunaliella salina]|uniref:S-adenosyl-L-methionine-dependent methyltransferase n=1 Tax=Dunaliella salina TaxID=3046 RepID=A0ABQ7H9J1_DUNSA|nr:S-adenosyl-L-methionine-dependent methyltransferase [Dunaliella salina]|eukprot:KAF5843524.1 S-adenosyl-L-methionine-dependent methyltransferase [Dunaliella salina]